MTQSAPVHALGAYLKAVRNALGMTLRDVESRTDKAITNGYLSQIEKGMIKQPSPNVLWQLGRVYQLEYFDLLRRAGHHLPAPEHVTKGTGAPHTGGQRARGSAGKEGRPIGLPKGAMDDLTEDEEQELLEYLALIRRRRARQAHEQSSGTQP